MEILNQNKYYDIMLVDPPWGGKEYKQGKDEEFA